MERFSLCTVGLFAHEALHQESGMLCITETGCVGFFKRIIVRREPFVKEDTSFITADSKGTAWLSNEAVK